jgi:hypothetical protein
VVVVREPLARAVAIYYWLGRRPAALRKLVGLKDAVTDPMQPPPVVKATHYAKHLPEAYTGPGASDLPRWPWHSFAWGAAEGVAMLEARRMAVVVLEHYDESLLALRRLMKWPLAEVLYTVFSRLFVPNLLNPPPPPPPATPLMNLARHSMWLSPEGEAAR